MATTSTAATTTELTSPKTAAFSNNVQISPKPPPPQPQQQPQTPRPQLATVKPVVVSAAPAAASQPQASPVIRTVTAPAAAAPQAQPIILSQQPATAVFGQSIIQASPQQMLQIQLPAASSTGAQIRSPLASKQQGLITTSQTTPKQPHLLPKPVSAAAVATPQSKSAVTTNTTPLILSGSTAGSTPLLINNLQLGQVAAAPPILIQQPNGVFVLRNQTATVSSTSATTLVPTIVSQAASVAPTAVTTGGAFLLQQPQQQPQQQVQQQQPQQITAQPQVKIITPQGRMQMQQIQTPSGPKLIAVPVGQTAAIVQQPQAAQQPQPTVISASSASPTTASTTESLIAAAANRAKKKSKKSKKSSSHVSPDKQKTATTTTTSTAAATIATSSGGLDLGELMKDVGLDLEGFGVDEQSLEAALPDIASQQQQQQSGSQLLAQIQQPLPMQPAAAAPTSGQYQLVQSADGQFMLQAQQPVITADGTQLLTVPAIQAQLPTTPIQQQQQQQQNPSAVSPTIPAAATTLTKVSNSASSPVSNANSSPTMAINREPLYEDERLPPFWHRRVSQRKSGASAGRYEVFIIGPTGKRFRSRNELKSFFEKTGEKSLDPDEFDFSPFGNGRSGVPNPVQNPVPSIRPSPAPIAPATASAASPVILQKSTALTTTATSVLTATTTSTSNILQNIQQPLPQKALDNVMAPPPTTSVQQQQQSPHPTTLTSQISRETAEADAQISQLLENWQKNPQQGLDIGNSEKAAEFIKTFGGGSTKTSVVESEPEAGGGSSSGGFQQQSNNFVNAANTMGGGPPSQMRALQNNLPPNTRLVRGPNGQLALQKVQAIELSPQMQQTLKLLQSRMQELERKAGRTPQEDAEMAQLQSKQQQILASGKPVATPTTAIQQPQQLVQQQPQPLLQQVQYFC